jgi:hypothetical protein
MYNFFSCYFVISLGFLFADGTFFNFSTMPFKSWRERALHSIVRRTFSNHVLQFIGLFIFRLFGFDGFRT